MQQELGKYSFRDIVSSLCVGLVKGGYILAKGRARVVQ